MGFTAIGARLEIADAGVQMRDDAEQHFLPALTQHFVQHHPLDLVRRLG
jgi:hypothetical protein